MTTTTISSSDIAGRLTAAVIQCVQFPGVGKTYAYYLIFFAIRAMMQGRSLTRDELCAINKHLANDILPWKGEIWADPEQVKQRILGHILEIDAVKGEILQAFYQGTIPPKLTRFKPVDSEKHFNYYTDAKTFNKYENYHKNSKVPAWYPFHNPE